MKLFHLCGCECARCCPSVEIRPQPVTQIGQRVQTAFVPRNEPNQSKVISGRANVRIFTQTAMSPVSDLDPVKVSDFWAEGKDGSHAMSASTVALTMNPRAYHAVMRDDFVPVGNAPALRSGLKRGGQSGLSVNRINIEDVAPVAYGDMVTLTAYGRVHRGGH